MVKRDANQAEIVRSLQAIGCTVIDLAAVGSGVPDLMVGYRGQTYLLEIKTKGGRINDLQHLFMAKWRGGPVNVVRTVDEALAVVGGPSRLLQRALAQPVPTKGAAKM